MRIGICLWLTASLLAASGADTLQEAGGQARVRPYREHGGPGWSQRPAPANIAARVYVANSLGDDITIINLATLQAAGTIKVGQAVHGLCAPADGRRLFTTVESEKTLKVIDTTTNRVVSTIPLTGTPNQCASTPDGRFVGVPIRDENSVDIVDMAQNKVVKVLPVKVPHNCFNAGSNHDLFVSSMGSEEIERIDLDRMEVAERIPVGGIPRPFFVTNDEKRIYAALSDLHGFVTVAVPRGGMVERTELPPAPAIGCTVAPHTPTHGLALSPDGSELWVTSVWDNRVYVVDVATRRVLGEIATGACPNWITFSPDGAYSAVSNTASNDTSIMATKSRREVARIQVGKGPKRLLIVNVPQR